MKPISLNSSARLSLIEVREISEEKSVDIFYKSNGKVDGGVYNWDEVKQFVRELAEALDMPLEVAAPKVEPIVLPKDVYEEVKEMKEFVDEAEDAQEARARADRKIWKSCRESPNDSAVAMWIDTTDGATLDLAKMLMGELPFRYEKRSWVLTVQSGNYLSKAYINESGGWSLEYSRDIKEAIKCSSYVAAVKLEATVSHVSTLEIKEV